jgi:hypothetical protein
MLLALGLAFPLGLTLVSVPHALPFVCRSTDCLLIVVCLVIAVSVAVLHVMDLLLQYDRRVLGRGR